MKPKRVLITGCSSGVGRAAAELLGDRGYSVFATVRNTERGEDLAAKARQRGWNIEVVQLDICDDDAVKQTVARIGRVDALVNNAGFQIYGPMEEMSISDLVSQFDTNVYGPFRLMKAVLPGMRERRSGVIVNISSYNGRLASPLNSIYCASKHALEGLTESLRYEVGHFGVRVHLVQPGYIVDTPFFETRPLVGASAGDEDSPYAEFVKERREKGGSLAPRTENTTPVMVAKAILHVIEEGNDFRYPVGEDAEYVLALRNSTDDREFDRTIREKLKLGW